MHGALEFCEVFFDDVVVPFERMLGDEGQGWAVAMDLLPYERSTALWHRAAYLHRRLQQLLERGPATARSTRSASARSPSCSTAFRLRSRATQHRMAVGRHSSAPRPRSTRCCWPPPSRPSSTWSRRAWPSSIVLGDDPAAERWRSEFLYSRAATIYGGSAEIQRNIIARRLLDLGSDR